jgi:hypothetical protein
VTLRYRTGGCGRGEIHDQTLPNPGGRGGVRREVAEAAQLTDRLTEGLAALGSQALAAGEGDQLTDRGFLSRGGVSGVLIRMRVLR